MNSFLESAEISFEGCEERDEQNPIVSNDINESNSLLKSLTYLINVLSFAKTKESKLL
jgi:hypothetical protein